MIWYQRDLLPPIQSTHIVTDTKHKFISDVNDVSEKKQGDKESGGGCLHDEYMTDVC